MTERNIVSVSEYNSWRNCGEAAYRKYVLNERGEPPTPELVRGSVVHRVACINLRAKKSEAARPCGTEETMALADAAWSEALDKNGVRFSGAEQEEGSSVVLGKEHDRAVRLSALHVEKIVPEVTPIEVEEDYTSEHPLSILGDQHLRGILDLVDRPSPGPSGMTVIRDMKTSKSKKSAFEVYGSFQLVIQAILYRLKTGKRPDAARLDVLVSTKGGKNTAPKTYVQEGLPLVTVEEDDEARVLEAMGRVVAMRKAGIPTPPATTGRDWFCSQKWCPFTGDCRFYNRRADSHAR